MAILDFLPARTLQYDRPGSPSPGEKPFLYALSTCVHCKRAKTFLNSLNISYDFIDVDKLSGDESLKVLAEMDKYNPNTTFPTIIIGTVVIIGYMENDIKKALGL